MDGVLHMRHTGVMVDSDVRLASRRIANGHRPRPKAVVVGNDMHEPTPRYFTSGKKEKPASCWERKTRKIPIQDDKKKNM